MDSGATAASQATVLAAAESAAAQVTDGLFLDLDTLWSFVHEARHSLCVLTKPSRKTALDNISHWHLPRPVHEAIMLCMLRSHQ